MGTGAGELSRNRDGTDGRRVLVWLLIMGGLAGCAGGLPDDIGIQANGQLAPCPSSPNCVSSLATDQKHAIASFVLATPSVVDWEAFQATIEMLPRTEVVDVSVDYLRAEASSALFRFVDDLELHRSPTGVVHVRSASRVGYSDLGVNRERVEQLRGMLLERGLIVAPRAAGASEAGK